MQQHCQSKSNEEHHPYNVSGFVERAEYNKGKAEYIYAGEHNEVCWATLCEAARGKVVIDCGATENMGSELAMEDLQDEHFKNTCQISEQSIGLDDTCKFRVGNGHSAHREARADVTVRAGDTKGQYKVYVQNSDNKYVPLLGSIKMLQKVGAISDFASGRCLLPSVCGDQLLQLGKASSGHLLLNIVGDILGNHAVSDSGCRRKLMQLRES